MPADKAGRISSWKISPAAGLTFQPTVFYWAYLHRGLAGSGESLGSRTEPLTHSAASAVLLGLNYFPPLLRPSAARTNPFISQAPLREPAQISGAVKALCPFHNSSSTSQPVRIIKAKQSLFKADQSLLKAEQSPFKAERFKS